MSAANGLIWIFAVFVGLIELVSGALLLIGIAFRTYTTYICIKVIFSGIGSYRLEGSTLPLIIMVGRRRKWYC